MNKRKSFEVDRGGFRKRPRYSNNTYHVELTLEQKLERDIVNIGEDLRENESVEVKLESLAKQIEENLDAHRTIIMNAIVECTAELPEKICYYSTLIGLVNAKDYNFGGEIVEGLVKNFKDYLKGSEWDKARSMVRCFGDLVNCHVISAGSLLNLFETLIDVTLEDSIPQVRSDYFVFCVLSALPWIGRELSEKKEQDLDQLLTTIENYIGKRSKAHQDTLRVWYSDSPHPQEEYLDCLWTQIVKLRSDKWVERHIQRTYLAFDAVISEALQHNLAQIIVPAHDPANVYPYPKVIFRFFDYTDVIEDGPVLPGAHSIERFLVEDSLRETLDQHHYQRKDCASALVKYPGRNKLPIDYMIVEVILGEMFALPSPKHIDIFYGSLLLELCKLQPSTMPPVLAQSVELLYNRLDTMNGACIDRFATWFAYHLSNFQFRWNWDDWATCVTLDPLHPKIKFVRETLVRCMRLSYHQKVVDLLPDEFQPVLPEPTSPINPYEEGKDAVGETELQHATEITNMLKEKLPTDELIEKLLAMSTTIDDMDATSFTDYQIKVFLTVVLNIASRSLTHLFSALGKYETLLKRMSSSEDGQLSILRTAFSVWKNHQQLLVLLTYKLVKADIVHGANVINWLFSSEMSADLTKSYVWEIIFSVSKRKVKRIEMAQAELETEKKSLAKFESGDTTDVALGDEESGIPSEEKVERLEEQVENYQSDLKNFYLVLFQRLILVISEHIHNCKLQSKPFKNYWFRWTIGRLQQLFFEDHSQIFDIVPTLESLVFSSDLDHHILLVFKQFKSLRV